MHVDGHGATWTTQRGHIELSCLPPTRQAVAEVRPARSSGAVGALDDPFYAALDRNARVRFRRGRVWGGDLPRVRLGSGWVGRAFLQAGADSDTCRPPIPKLSRRSAASTVPPVLRLVSGQRIKDGQTVPISAPKDRQKHPKKE